MNNKLVEYLHSGNGNNVDTSARLLVGKLFIQLTMLKSFYGFINRHRHECPDGCKNWESFSERSLE